MDCDWKNILHLVGLVMGNMFSNYLKVSDMGLTWFFFVQGVTMWVQNSHL